MGCPDIAMYSRNDPYASNASALYRIGISSVTQPLFSGSDELTQILWFMQRPRLHITKQGLAAISGSIIYARRIVSFVRSALSGITGTAEIRKAVNHARRALRAKSSEPDDARIWLTKAATLLRAVVAWRDREASKLLPKLKVYMKLLSPIQSAFEANRVCRIMSR